MLLGLSSLDGGLEPEVGAVGGSDRGDGGVADGALLARFAEAVHAAGRPGSSGEAADDLASARTDVEAAVGPAGLVDAAAVCANFNMMVRIADGTGTPLDAGTVDVSTDLRSELDLDHLASRRVVSS